MERDRAEGRGAGAAAGFLSWGAAEPAESGTCGLSTAAQVTVATTGNCYSSFGVAGATMSPGDPMHHHRMGTLGEAQAVC